MRNAFYTPIIKNQLKNTLRYQ